MKRHLPHGLRTGATVVGVAAGLMVLGYTGQSTDGFVHTSLAGPLGLFGPDSVTIADGDVLAIGSGPSDAAALAALLKATTPAAQPAEAPASTPSVFQAGAAANVVPPEAMPGVISAPGAFPAPAAAPAPAPGAPAPAGVPAPQTNPVPVVDGQGKVDCTGAVSCLLDPKTNVTTVTYSDGTMALIHRINGMTLVEYQNVIGKPQNQVKAPAPVVPAPMPVAAVPAKPVPSPLASVAVPAAPATPAPAPEAPAVDLAPSVNPGPATTVRPSLTIPGLTASAARPRVTISQPPQDFTPSRPSVPPPAASTPGTSSAVSGALDVVKEAVGSVVDAIGKAVNPGASTPGKHANSK